MRKIDPQKLRLVVLLLIGCFLICAILFSMQRHFAEIEKLKDMEIYEVSFSYVQLEKRTETHYMICEPPNGKKQIQEKVDAFLSAENVVEELKLRSVNMTKELGLSQKENQPLQGMNLIFLAPSEDLDIGEYPDDIYDSKYHMGEHRVVTVVVSFVGGEQYEIEYLWPRE